MTDVLDELARFQRHFSAVLRQPLERSTGALRAQPARYPRELHARVRAGGVDIDERLAVYNRQYWFRLFSVLQREHRLTTALLGAWDFNQLAERYLRARPPTGHALAEIAEGLDAFAAVDDELGAVLRGVPEATLVDSFAIDAAFRKAMRAATERRLDPAQLDEAQLVRGRFAWSRACTLVHETRPLVALRNQLPPAIAEARVALPALHPDGVRSWVISRSSRGLHVTPVPALAAELLWLLRRHSIRDALATLERTHADDAVADVAGRCFAEGMALGFWTGVEVAA